MATCKPELINISREENLQIQWDNLNVQRRNLETLEISYNKLLEIQEKNTGAFLLVGGMAALIDIESKISKAKESVLWAEEMVDKYRYV